MRTSLRLVTVSFALGLSMWACGGDDEGSNGGTAASGGSMAAGEGGSNSTGATNTNGGSSTNGGSNANGGSNTNGGTETAGTSMGGMAAAGAPMDVAGQAPIGGDTTTMGGAPVGGAPDMAGAPAVIDGGAGGAGGAPPAPSCTTTGTVPDCSKLSAPVCSQVDGCSAAATACGGDPKPCSDLILPGQCNSTQGCMTTQAGCADDPNNPRIACNTHPNTGPSCLDAGCTYTPCGGTAVACSTLDETGCIAHATYCTWQ